MSRARRDLDGYTRERCSVAYLDSVIRFGLTTILAVLASCAADGPADRSVASATWFVERTAESELVFTHRAISSACEESDSYDGPGVCAFDANGDLRPDLFFPNRAGAASALLLNDHGRFRDVTVQANLVDVGDAVGCLAFDYDGDADDDLFVTGITGNRLMRNVGGVFEDVTAAAGVDLQGYSTTASAGDIDGDGDLDLFVARMVELDSCDDACTPLPINCPTMSTNLLYINEGGRFREAAFERGITDADPSLAAMVVDLDQDGDLDIFVGNDKGYAHPDRLYLNDGSGTFMDVGPTWGVDALGTDTMGVAVGDVNEDVLLDMVVTDYSGKPTILYLGAGDSFERGTLGPRSTDFVNWGVVLADFNHDGHLDLLQTSGSVQPQAMGSQNQLFAGDGSGELAYVQPSDAGLEVGGRFRGLALLDHDADGDMDMVVTENGGRARLFENTAADGRARVLQPDVPPYGSGYLGSHWMITSAAPSP